MLGASNKYTAEEQLDQIAFYWINLHDGEPQGLTVHIVSQDRDVTFDLDGGNRIPKAAERQAESVAELRAAGIGVRRVLFVHDGTLDQPATCSNGCSRCSRRKYISIWCPSRPMGEHATVPEDVLQKDQNRAEQLGRAVTLLPEKQPNGPDLVQLAREGDYNVIVLPWSEELRAFSETPPGEWVKLVLHNSPCSVFLASHPVIPREVVSES